MIEEENNFEEYMETEWTLKLFCINSDNLIPYSLYNNNNNQIEEHYFSNCDCKRRIRNKNDFIIIY